MDLIYIIFIILHLSFDLFAKLFLRFVDIVVVLHGRLMQHKLVIIDVVVGADIIWLGVVFAKFFLTVITILL